MILSSVRPRLLGLGAAAAVLVTLVWYFALWSPRSSAYNKARAEVTQSEATIQSLQAQIAQLQAQAKSGSGASGPRQAIETAAIPPQANLAQLIDQVNSAANSSGVTFVSITPSQPAAPSVSSGVGSPGASVISVTINAVGGYYQIVDFINRLDSLPRLMVIQSVNMAPGGTSSASAKSGGVRSGSGSELTVTLSTQVYTTAVPASAAGSTTTTTAAGSGSTTTTRASTTTTVP